MFTKYIDNTPVIPDYELTNDEKISLLDVYIISTSLDSYIHNVVRSKLISNRRNIKKAVTELWYQLEATKAKAGEIMKGETKPTSITIFKNTVAAGLSYPANESKYIANEVVKWADGEGTCDWTKFLEYFNNLNI